MWIFSVRHEELHGLVRVVGGVGERDKVRRRRDAILVDCRARDAGIGCGERAASAAINVMATAIAGISSALFHEVQGFMCILMPFRTVDCLLPAL